MKQLASEKLPPTHCFKKANLEAQNGPLIFNVLGYVLGKGTSNCWQGPLGKSLKITAPTNSAFSYLVYRSYFMTRVWKSASVAILVYLTQKLMAEI